MGKEWDIQPGESSEAYVAFSKYLTMLNRSGEALSRDTGLSLPTIKEWRRLNHWRNRARAYDLVMGAELIKAQQKLVTSNQETIITDSLIDYNLLIIKWREMVNKLVPEDLTPNALMSIIGARKRIDDLGRRAVKLPNVYVNNEVAVPPIPPQRQLNWNNPIAELQQSNDGDSSTEEE